MGIDKNKSKTTEAAELRRRAEEELKTKTAEARSPRTDAESQRLLHELQVHQIELEMQNAELLRSRDAVETALEMYTDLYDFAPVGYFTLDRSETIRSVNLTGASLLGVDRARLIGRRFGSFITPEDRPTFNSFLGKVFTNQGKEASEVALLKERKPRFFIQIEAIAAASRDECRIAVIDITERKRVDRLLQARFRILAAAKMPLGEMLQMVLDEIESQTGSEIGFYHFIDTDQEMLSLQKWSTNTLRNMCSAEGEGSHYPVSQAGVWVDCVHERRPVIHNDYASLPNRKGMPTGHAPVIREMVIPILRGERIVAIIGVGNKPTDYNAIDVEITSLLGDFSWEIVERKISQEKLSKSERQLAEAQSIAQIGSWEWDSISDEISGSDEFNRMFGLILSSYESFMEVVHPNYREMVNKAVQETLDRQTPYNVHYSIIRPDGVTRIIHAQGIAIVDNAGKTVRMIGTAQDVTVKRKMEEQMEILNAEIAAHAVDLEAANIELEAFNYMVAHDLRNPLNTISGYSQVIQQVCGDKLDEECKGYVQQIYETTHRMDKLIGTLLKFSHLLRVELCRNTVDLSEMAHEVAASLKMSEPDRRVMYRITEGLKVKGDANLLRIVLDNLIGNAWKYSSNREGTVIEFGMKEIEEKPACFVRDNGVGFDMAKADKLFLPFQRINESNVKGHGIGLSTVERIIRRHGGRVWAESEPGKGATFYFTLSAK